MLLDTGLIKAGLKRLGPVKGSCVAVKTKYPEQIVIAIAKDKNGKPNPITLGWTMIASGSPPMMAVAVANFECTLESQTEVGDHIIFIGRVVASHINTEPKKRLYTIAPNHKLGPAS